MKNNLLFILLFAGSFFMIGSVQSQSPHLTYAVTDSVHNGVTWNYLRTLDTKTGAYSTIQFPLLNKNELQQNPGISAVLSHNGVAAIAYDKKNKRLYYTPMLTDRLAYIDLANMSNHIVTNNFTGLLPKESDQSNIITRMVLGEDGQGYALTNDARHLIRFRTSGNPGITDLGSVSDDYGNNEISVHAGCISYGGDIIADDDGHLYLFTAGRYVFKIDIRNKVAKYMGTIKGLPGSFNISGAAVDKKQENIVIVSNVDASDVYILDIKTLIAGRLYANNPFFASDLTNASVLKSKENTQYREDGNIVMNDNIQLYPNPVTGNEFKINFINLGYGTYTVRVIDINGKSIISKEVTTGGKTNVILINLPRLISNGIYIVRVTDTNNKTWYSGKIIVQ